MAKLDLSGKDAQMETVAQEYVSVEEMHKIYRKMEEMYQAWSNGEPPPPSSEYFDNPSLDQPPLRPQNPTPSEQLPSYPPTHHPYQQYLTTNSSHFQYPPTKNVTHPTPSNAQIFVVFSPTGMPDTTRVPILIVQGPMLDAKEEIVNGVQNLFLRADMVEISKETDDVVVRTAEPNKIMNNWEATLLPVSKEPWWFI